LASDSDRVFMFLIIWSLATEFVFHVRCGDWHKKFKLFVIYIHGRIVVFEEFTSLCGFLVRTESGLLCNITIFLEPKSSIA
jgi:hypothetical protein